MRLKRELFVAEQQLQRSEEEGELNKKDTTKLTNTKPRKLMTCTVKQTHKPASKDRSVDSKGVRFKQTDQVTLSGHWTFRPITISAHVNFGP